MLRVSQKAIRKLCERIAIEFKPKRIVLFGSHARGRSRPGSDVDLLVVLPFQGNGIRKAIAILNHVNPPFPVDLIVKTPGQLKQRLAWNDFFLREIMEKGRVLYEATRS